MSQSHMIAPRRFLPSVNALLAFAAPDLDMHVSMGEHMLYFTKVFHPFNIKSFGEGRTPHASQDSRIISLL